MKKSLDRMSCKSHG